MNAVKKEAKDFTEGKILPAVIKFTLPIAAMYILQNLYNSADMFVLANFCEDENALGSVGCTTALINLILGLFIGIGSGVNVVMSQFIGAKDGENVKKSVGTAFILSIISGVIIGVIGLIISRSVLKLIGTDDVFIDGAATYMRIYFCGSVGNLGFSFCSAILNARGETSKPLIYSTVGGVLNVILNILFVTAFDMGIAGVATATIISQFVSFVCAVIYLTGLKDECRLAFSHLAFDRAICLKFLSVGIPSGIEGSLFALSSAVIQSGYNSLSPTHVNGNTAGGNVDSYLYFILHSLSLTALTFASQNYGAKKFDRVKRSITVCALCCFVTGAVLGATALIFAPQLVSIFTKNPEEIAIGCTRLYWVGMFYFLCVFMGIGGSALRSIGYSSMSTVISLLGSCVLRIIWVYTVFRKYHFIECLYAVFPISWGLTSLVLFIAFGTLLKKKERLSS